MFEVVLVMVIKIVFSAVGAIQVSSLSVGSTIPYEVLSSISTTIVVPFLISLIMPTEYACFI